MLAEVWGAGSGGTGASTALGPGGGGGGYSAITLNVTSGQTVYFNVGAHSAGASGFPSDGGNSWVNITSNTQPSSAADGCVGGGGKAPVDGFTGGLGGSGTLGTTNHTGGNGAPGSNPLGGGGGGGAGSAANGANGTTGVPPNNGAGGSPDGGAGGSGQANAGDAGTAPGGGGGGSWGSTGGNGGDGQVRLTFSAPPTTLTPGLVTDSDTVFAPTSLNRNTVAPSRSAGFKTWFNGLPLVGFKSNRALKYWFNGLPAPYVSGPLVASDDSFFAPTVSLGVAPTALYTDTDTFYAPHVLFDQALAPSLYTDTDTFFAPTLSGSYTLTPGLVTDTDTFYGGDISQGQILTPSLYTDTDTFFAPTLSGSYTLTPSLYTDTDSFFAPTLTQPHDTLAPSLYSDTDSFFAPTVEDIGALGPALYTDTDSFFAPTVTPGSVTLTPSLVTDTDTIYAAFAGALAPVAPSFYSDTDSFFAPTITTRGAILPGLVDDSAVIHAPVVSSSQTLTAPLVTEADTIRSTVVTNGYPLNPGLVTDTDTFRAPTLVPGPVTIRPSTVSSVETFYTPTVQQQTTQGGGGGGNGSIPANVKYATPFTLASSGLITALQIQANTANPTVHTRMMLYADSAGVPGVLLAQSAVKTGVVSGTNSYTLTTPYSVLVGTKVWVAIHTDATLNVLGNSKNGSRYNTDLFSDGASDPFGASSLDNKKAPVLLVILNNPNASVTPSLYVDSETFFAPTLTYRNTLTPPLLVDTDFFYAPRVARNVQPGIYTDSDTIYAPAITVGAVTLTPTLYTDAESFYQPMVAAFAPTVFPPLVVDGDVIKDEVIVTPEGGTMTPGTPPSDDAFFAPVVLDTVTLRPAIHAPTDPETGTPDSIFHPVLSKGSVTLRPSKVTEIDQFWIEAVVRGVGTTTLRPGFVAADDTFYSPVQGVAPRKRTVALKGSTRQHTTTMTARTANGINLIGDDSKVDIELEGNDA